jgi:hypothetical protein
MVGFLWLHVREEILRVCNGSFHHYTCPLCLPSVLLSTLNSLSLSLSLYLNRRGACVAALYNGWLAVHAAS